MKDNLGSDYFLIAHVDVDKAIFKTQEELGIEFINSIDAWNRMAFNFRNKRNDGRKYARNDLNPLVYRFRSKVD